MIPHAVISFLAWPADTGVAGAFLYTVLLGAPAYIHTHKKMTRHHQERLDAAKPPEGDNHEA